MVLCPDLESKEALEQSARQLVLPPRGTRVYQVTAKELFFPGMDQQAFGKAIDPVNGPTLKEIDQRAPLDRFQGILEKGLRREAGLAPVAGLVAMDLLSGGKGP